jgi:hypothetical protein
VGEAYRDYCHCLKEHCRGHVRLSLRDPAGKVVLPGKQSELLVYWGRTGRVEDLRIQRPYTPEPQ